MMYEPLLREQSTLFVCSLICRAWSTRAQILLWRRPLLFSQQSVRRFIKAVQADATNHLVSLVCEIRETGAFADASELSSTFSTDLTMRALPNLRVMYGHSVTWDAVDLHPRAVRMRLPFLSTLRKLEIYRSVIDSLRMFLDVVWSCGELTHLTVSQVLFADEISIYHPKKIMHRWSSLARERKACKKLTHLSVYATAFSAHNDMIVGALFGSAITTVDTTLKATSQDIEFEPHPFLISLIPRAS
ncbi:hypothetical protein PYCCODRAFT_1055630 [Trametes coccinea BRFM310]|uniref:F-box domain-containing protein n=1 Tax=Trametes coccinea (strain BRFM310) TaxID=1353009 RepID=A0A1Y2IZ01_TRAC3|nr:hypothetical protein PYCCODRAFT_1055630 [Trametes coccinea BRFM310]